MWVSVCVLSLTILNYHPLSRNLILEMAASHLMCVNPSCWKFAHIQPVPKKGDCSNSSNYCPITLISCLSKAFDPVLNKKIMRHLSAHNLLSDCQYGFRKGRSTGDLLVFLNESWSSSFRDFSETFAVMLALTYRSFLIKSSINF